MALVGFAVGCLAVGCLAIGCLAIGCLAIGCLAIGCLVFSAWNIAHVNKYINCANTFKIIIS